MTNTLSKSQVTITLKNEILEEVKQYNNNRLTYDENERFNRQVEILKKIPYVNEGIAKDLLKEFSNDINEIIWATPCNFGLIKNISNEQKGLIYDALELCRDDAMEAERLESLRMGGLLAIIAGIVGVGIASSPLISGADKFTNSDAILLVSSVGLVLGGAVAAFTNFLRK